MRPEGPKKFFRPAPFLISGSRWPPPSPLLIWRSGSAAEPDVVCHKSNAKSFTSQNSKTHALFGLYFVTLRSRSLFHFQLTLLQVNVIKMFLRKQYFFLTSGCFLWAPDNSNFFRFPFKVPVIGSRRVCKVGNSRKKSWEQFFLLFCRNCQGRLWDKNC